MTKEFSFRILIKKLKGFTPFKQTVWFHPITDSMGILTVWEDGFRTFEIENMTGPIDENPKPNWEKVGRL